MDEVLVYRIEKRRQKRENPFSLTLRKEEKEILKMEEKKNVVKEEEKLDKVAGGESFGKKCPHCGSGDVSLYYEHDEIGVFRCNKCGHQFTENW